MGHSVTDSYLSVQRAKFSWHQDHSAWILNLFETISPSSPGESLQTLLVSVLSIILATVLALLAALGRLSTIPPVYALSTFYVSLIRGTPLYLQIFFFFLALPQLGIILPGLFAGVLALGLNYGAYMSEIFRAGSSLGRQRSTRGRHCPWHDSLANHEA